MVTSELDDLYGDAILQHRRHPRNHSRLPGADATSKAVNPFCGDEVEIQLVFRGGRVSRVGVQAVGCSINQASASMLSEVLAGKTAEEIRAVADRFRKAMSGSGASADGLEDLGDTHALLVVRQYPVRIKCALLPWSALEEATDEYGGELGDEA
jgi:nitrogen fixation NifU-like protein